MRISKTFVLAIFVLFAFSKVAADITLTQEVTKPDDPDFKTTMIMYAASDKMKIENNEDEVDVIFDINKEEMIIIQHNKESYMVMDKEYMEKVAGQIERAMKMMEKQLKNMPASQRERMKSMMGDKMPGGKKIIIDYKKTGDTKSYKSWDLTKYNVLVNDEHKMNYWVTDFDDLGIDESDMAIFKDFSNYMEEFTKSLGSSFESIGIYGLKQNFKKIDGYPVINEQLDDNGKVERAGKLTDIDKSGISSSVFDIPSGYSEEEKPDMK